MVMAAVIGVVLTTPLAPSACQRVTARGTLDSAAQREVRVHVLARRIGGLALQALLNAREGFLADDAFMFSLAHGNAPFGRGDIPGIEDLLKDTSHLLLTYAAARQRLRELRLRLKKALHFRLTGQPSTCIAFHSFADDGGQRFVMDEDLPAALVSHVFEADGRRRLNAVSLFNACLGFLSVLTTELQAFQFTSRSGDDLVEHALWRVFEVEVEAFAHRTAFLHDTAKPKVELYITAVAFEIVEDHNKALAIARIHIGQKSYHAGALHKITAAGHIVREYGFNRVTLRFRILAATVFLTL